MTDAVAPTDAQTAVFPSDLAEKIVSAIDDAAPFEDNFQSENGQLRDDDPKPAPDSKWIFTGRELLETPITKPPCLLEPVLQTTSFSLLLGESDIGKTWLALSLLLAVASREPEWLGYELKPTHGRAILIATEDSEYNLAGRFHALQTAYPPTRWRDNIRVLIADDKSNSEIIKELTKMMRDEPIDLIVADCFGDLFDGRDANSQAETRKFYKQFATLAKSCHFMIIHHKAKRTEDKTPNKNHSLGSQAIEAKARTIFDLTESNAQFYLSVLKCKASRDEKKRSKRLEFDEKLLLFRDTGETVARTQIGAEAESSIDWAPLFKGSERMKRATLAESYSSVSGRGRSAAFGKIKRAVGLGELNTDDFGNILNPAIANDLEPDAAAVISPVQTPKELDEIESESAQAVDSATSEPIITDLRLFLSLNACYGSREMKARANLNGREFRAALQKGLLEGWLIPRGGKYERVPEPPQNESSPSNSSVVVDGLDKLKRHRTLRSVRPAKANQDPSSSSATPVESDGFDKTREVQNE